MLKDLSGELVRSTERPIRGADEEHAKRPIRGACEEQAKRPIRELVRRC